MIKPTLKKWNSAEHLESAEDMAFYLEACIEEAGDDAAFIAKALGNVAREVGMSREGLYKALSGKGNPRFATILKVARAMGLRLHISPAA